MRVHVSELEFCEMQRYIESTIIGSNEWNRDLEMGHNICYDDKSYWTSTFYQTLSGT